VLHLPTHTKGRNKNRGEEEVKFEFHEIEVRRKTLAKILVGVFLFNLVVMGADAAYSYQAAPRSRVRPNAPTRPADRTARAR